MTGIQVESATESFDWNEVGSEIGVEAKNKEEFVQQVKNLIENPVKDNQKISEIQEFIKRSDEDLVIADMQASKFDDDYIEDTVNKLKESGLLKRSKLRLEHNFRTHITKVCSERLVLRDEKCSEQC